MDDYFCTSLFKFVLRIKRLAKDSYSVFYLQFFLSSYVSKYWKLSSTKNSNYETLYGVGMTIAPQYLKR